LLLVSAPAFKVLLKSPFSHFSGYGHDGLELARALHNWGADVYVQPVWLDVPIPQDLMPLFGKSLAGPFDLTICHWDPPHVEITRHGREVTRLAVAWTMWEMCADVETEIFTRRGWLRWDQVTEEDQTLGINPETDLAEWQQVERVSSFHGRRSMVARDYQGHSSLTTRNHSWLVKDGRGQWKWRTSDTLQRHDQVPRSAVLAELPQSPKYSDAFVEMVAWTYTEGWLERGQSIRIGQSARANPEETERIRAALHALLGPPRVWGGVCQRCGDNEPDSQGRVTRARSLCHRCYEHQRNHGQLDQWLLYEAWTESPEKADGAVFFNISRHASQEILVCCPDKVPSHDFLLSLTRAQLELFIQVSCLADGWHVKSGCWGFAQTIGPRLEAFIYACVLAGKSVSSPKPRAEFPHLTSVLVGSRRFTSPERAARETPEAKQVVEYDGIVWCPTVRHGNWLARRHGTMYYTGNTSLRPHCEGRSKIREHLRWFDAVLGYSDVTMQALEPYIPKAAHHGVLQGGFEAGEWKYMERDWSGDAVFRFGVHGALNRRKEPMVTLQAFNELCHEHPEFKEGARLLMHSSMPGSGVIPEMNEVFERSGIGVRMYLGAWDKLVLEQFYQACHALVYPSHGEGKNLPALEHAATGGVELVTDWSGHQQWLREDCAYPLACEVVPMFPGKPELAHWAVVEVAEVKRAMWHVFTHRAEAKAKGDLASRLIPQMCSWDAVAETLFRRLRDLVPVQGEIVHSLAMSCRREQQPVAQLASMAGASYSQSGASRPEEVADGVFRG
jgi:glycosyltransferase involved in cell wall biosynthesis